MTIRSLQQRVSGRWWPLLALVWLLAGGSAMAQPDDGSGSTDSGRDTEQTAPEGEDETSVIDQPGGIEAASENVDELDEETGDEEDRERGPDGPSGRFIPSEQISQDLSVSFPADI